MTSVDDAHKKVSKGVIIGGIVAACALVLVVVLVFLMGSTSSEKKSGDAKNSVSDSGPITVEDFQKMQEARGTQGERVKFVNQVIALAFNWENSDEYKANRELLVKMGVPEDSQLLSEYMPKLSETTKDGVSSNWIDAGHVTARSYVSKLGQEPKDLFPNYPKEDSYFHVENRIATIKELGENGYNDESEIALVESVSSSPNTVLISGGVLYSKRNNISKNEIDDGALSVKVPAENGETAALAIDPFHNKVIEEFYATSRVGIDLDFVFDFKDSTSLDLKNIRVITARS